MGRDVLGVVTGLAVFFTGVLAVAGLTGPADQPAVESPTPPITTPEPATAEIGGELPGVGPAVIRVLRWSGHVEPARDEDLAQLPPSVANLLIEYGVPLRVPTGSGTMQ